ncbi:MAG: LysR family transcriptional regulator, partial [Planctomycetales bacterium]|nr:LysR family transcriptional regulator [Planctomycetales bacterium]
MQLKLIKLYCDIAAQRSFSRGAKENSVSQSAASQMISQLEQRLDVKLIDRSKRPFVLTAEGDLFYREGRKLLTSYQKLEDKVRNLHSVVSGRVRVASIYSVGLSHMNQSVQDFMSANPKTNIRIEYQHPDRVYELIERDEVDFGLVSYPKNSRTVEAIAWRNEPMVLVCSKDNPLAELQRATLRHFHGQQMVAFQRGLRIRHEIDKALTMAGIEVNVVMQFDNTETMKRAIEIDSGIGLLPEPTVSREVSFGTLAAIPLVGETSLVRPLGIVWR